MLELGSSVIVNGEKDLGVGLANPQLSHGRRQMLDLVNRLHSTGVQVDIDLPQIAVIGSQSAGKSSLIESISGITLPRAAGTCTRCPTECRLSKSNNPWQCVISLRFTTDPHGQPLGQARNQVFGGVIHDKAQVEDRIRRAQVAILNPSQPIKQFLEADDLRTYTNELSFSNNAVSLQISGPDVADLSFVDLPGLIASISSNSSGNSSSGSNDIALVQSLVTAYIKKPNCIILLAVACETDFENQGAHRLTKQYDSQGKRTIGVLTKPDRIPTGEEGNWLPFIRNEKESLENGWFCVKQPSSHELKQNPTWEGARRAEDHFFTTTAPWCELDSVYRKHLRTSNLVDRLSTVLSDLISKRMPEIFKELDANIKSCEKALAALPPPPPENPQSEIATRLYNFVSDLERHVEGIPDQDGLLQAIRPAQERFRRAIRGTAPNFRPFDRKFEDKYHIAAAKFLVEEEGGVWEYEESDYDDDDDEDDDEDEVSKKKKKESPKGRNDIVDLSMDSDDPVSLNTPTTVARSSTKRKHHQDNKIFIDDVMERANRARTRELPGHFPFVVQKTFIQSLINQWKIPALELCNTIHQTVSAQVSNLVSKHFRNFGQGYLEQRLKTIMHQHIEQCKAEADKSITWLIELEDVPFSLNTHYLSDYKDKFLAYYKGERQRHNGSAVVAILNENNNERVREVLAALAAIGLTGIDTTDLQKLLPTDQMDHALDIMADVRAYFQVAYKRFADNIPLSIDRELMRGMTQDVLKKISDQLGINSTEGYDISADFAQESPQVADKRADLGKKLERLQGAQRQLSRFGTT